MAKYSFYSNKLHKVFGTVEELEAAEKAAMEKESKKVGREKKIGKLKEEISELKAEIGIKANEIGKLQDEEREESEKERLTFYKKDGNKWTEIYSLNEIIEDLLRTIR